MSNKISYADIDFENMPMMSESQVLKLSHCSCNPKQQQQIFPVKDLRGAPLSYVVRKTYRLYGGGQYASEATILENEANNTPRIEVTPLLMLLKVGNICDETYYRIVYTDVLARLSSHATLRCEIFNAICSKNFKTVEELTSAIDAVNAYINKFDLGILDNDSNSCSCYGYNSSETSLTVFGTLEEATEFGMCIPENIKKMCTVAAENHINDLKKLKRKYEKVLTSTTEKLERIDKLIESVTQSIIDNTLEVSE